MSPAAVYTRKAASHVIASVLLFSSITMVGCGGGKLIPRDVKDYMAQEYGVDRRNFDVTIPFRTTLIRRTPRMPLIEAREAEREFITKFFAYCRRDGITNFQNDTLLFLLRLDADPDINLKYYSTAMDGKAVVEGSMDEETFISRCLKQENWTEE